MHLSPSLASAIFKDPEKELRTQTTRNLLHYSTMLSGINDVNQVGGI